MPALWRQEQGGSLAWAETVHRQHLVPHRLATLQRQLAQAHACRGAAGRARLSRPGQGNTVQQRPATQLACRRGAVTGTSGGAAQTQRRSMPGSPRRTAWA